MKLLLNKSFPIFDKGWAFKINCKLNENQSHQNQSKMINFEQIPNCVANQVICMWKDKQ